MRAFGSFGAREAFAKLLGTGGVVESDSQKAIHRQLASLILPSGGADSRGGKHAQSHSRHGKRLRRRSIRLRMQKASRRRNSYGRRRP